MGAMRTPNNTVPDLPYPSTVISLWKHVDERSIDITNTEETIFQYRNIIPATKRAIAELQDRYDALSVAKDSLADFYPAHTHSNLMSELTLSLRDTSIDLRYLQRAYSDNSREK